MGLMSAACNPLALADDLHRLFDKPVDCRRIELLAVDDECFTRITCNEGSVGFAPVTFRMPVLLGLFTDHVLPFWLGQDLRQLPNLIPACYRHRSNYKFSGMAIWSGIAAVELAVVDLLARRLGWPVHRLLGPKLRESVAVRATSPRRDTDPAEEIAELEAHRTVLGAQAVKFRIGGRFQCADPTPGRTESLLKEARRVLPACVAIHVDANGSYDEATAIRVGAMLDDVGVSLFEEPVPFEQFEACRRVAHATRVPVAAGEQETREAMFAWMCREHGADVIMADINYNGGLLRTRRVAALAEATGLPFMTHIQGHGHHLAVVCQLLAVLPNADQFLSYSRRAPRMFEVRDGKLDVSDTPGFGLDADLLHDGRTVAEIHSPPV